MTRALSLVLFPAIILGCGDKKNAAPEAAADKGSGLSVEMPDHPDAPAYAKAFLDREVEGFRPTGNSDFTWDQVEFRSDGTWSAQATMSVGGDSAPCKEVGTWTVDDVESKTVGTMVWTITKTDCAIRSDGESQRVQVGIDGSGLKLSVR